MEKGKIYSGTFRLGQTDTSIKESRRNDQVRFVFVSPVKGTSLFRGKEHFFWVRKPNFNLLSGDTLALKK